MVASGVDLLRPASDALIAWGANFGPKTTGGQWWRLFASVFLHIGAIHLAFNMYVLWSVGHFVERLVGNAGFLVLYGVHDATGTRGDDGQPRQHGFQHRQALTLDPAVRRCPRRADKDIPRCQDTGYVARGDPTGKGDAVSHAELAGPGFHCDAILTFTNDNGC